jgi:hypothetical protein
MFAPPAGVINVQEHVPDVGKRLRRFSKLPVPTFEYSAVHATGDLVHVSADATKLSAKADGVGVTQEQANAAPLEVTLSEQHRNTFSDESRFLGDSLVFAIGKANRRAFMIAASAIPGGLVIKFRACFR